MISANIITAELAQLSLCSVTDADTVAENDEAAAADIEMLSQIYRGYETDPWFATLPVPEDSWDEVTADRITNLGF